MKRSLLAVSLSFAAASASAATIDVTRFDDPAPDGCAVNGCTLREAVAQANVNVDFDLVRLPAGTFTLSPQASGSVTIESVHPRRSTARRDRPPSSAPPAWDRCCRHTPISPCGG